MAGQVAAVLLLQLLLLSILLEMAVHCHAKSPPSGSVKIEGFSYNGDGCPFGSMEGSVSVDGQGLTSRFSKLTATLDQGEAGMRKSCTITVKIDYPLGFVYSVETVSMRGHANLVAGVVGSVQTSYYISGLPGTAKASHEIKGAFRDYFSYTEEFLNVVYSECNKVRDFNLKAEVRVHPREFEPPTIGVVTMDSQDLQILEISARLRWKSC